MIKFSVKKYQGRLLFRPLTKAIGGDNGDINSPPTQVQDLGGVDTPPSQIIDLGNLTD